MHAYLHPGLDQNGNRCLCWSLFTAAVSMSTMLVLVIFTSLRLFFFFSEWKHVLGR